MIAKSRARFVMIILILFITGCSSQTTENIEDMVTDYNESINTGNIVSSEHEETEQTEEVSREIVTEIERGDISLDIDYDFLEEKYGIYVENICTDPQSIYENPIILELEKEHLEYEKEMKSKIPEILVEEHDYFVFDFNGDRLDDYLVCLHGILWSGSGGNLISMYVQQEGGEFVQRLSVTAKIDTDDPYEHAAIVVLNQRVDGYYSIVFPWTKNRVWSYERERERYGTYKYADEVKGNNR